jgi:beta-lactam-binding protein with PASTA domain
VEQATKKPAVEPRLPQTARGPLRYEFIRETKAPVAVKPIEEAPSNQADGQSSTSGRHGLWFSIDTNTLTVDPGREVSVGAQLINKGTVVEGVDIRVLGVPEDWVRIEPPRVNLDVRGQAALTIHFAPPKATTTPAGSVEVEVAVWSVSNPQVRCAEHVRLDVGAYHDLEIEHAPRELTVRRSGQFSLDLRNNGNYPIGVGAQPTSGSPAEGKVLLKFEPRTMTLPAGGIGVLTVHARAARRLLSGTPVMHTLQLDIQGGGAAKPVEVKMVQQPLLPRWAPKVLTLTALVVAVLIGLAAWNWYKHRPQTVPAVVNQPVDLAQANLSKAGFKAVASKAVNAKVASGTVFRQDPPGGTHRHKGTIVAITVSSGPPTVSVADLNQLTQQQAVAALAKEGLQVQVVMAASASVPVGLVSAQSPAQATAVPVGSTVTITVSSGAQAVPVPAIKGLTEADAIALLGQVNLRYAKAGTVPNDQMIGQVVTQSPAPGTSIAGGSTVTATIGVPSTATTTSGAASSKP